MPVADCGAFEVGERSEVGVLESPPSGSLLGLRRNNRSRLCRDKKSPSLRKDFYEQPNLSLLK